MAPRWGASPSLTQAGSAAPETARPWVHDAVRAAVPGLRAFAISLTEKAEGLFDGGWCQAHVQKRNESQIKLLLAINI